jgi:hypothetical protein
MRMVAFVLYSVLLFGLHGWRLKRGHDRVGAYSHEPHKGGNILGRFGLNVLYSTAYAQLYIL